MSAKKLAEHFSELEVESIRSINGSGKVEAEIRHFLSSCTDAPEMLAKAIRQRWTNLFPESRSRAD